MEGILKQELFDWIKKLHHTCLTLNEELVRSFALDKEPLLAGRDRFSLPGIAVVKRVIPRRGIVNDITYHLHGNGISFVTAEQVSVSFSYYPRVSQADTPILGCFDVCQFIRSSSPLNPLAEESLIRDYVLTLMQEAVVGRVDDVFFQFYLIEPGKVYAPTRSLSTC